jgi:hypothetical protein
MNSNKAEIDNENHPNYFFMLKQKPKREKETIEK